MLHIFNVIFLSLSKNVRNKKLFVLHSDRKEYIGTSLFRSFFHFFFLKFNLKTLNLEFRNKVFIIFLQMNTKK